MATAKPCTFTSISTSTPPRSMLGTTRRHHRRPFPTPVRNSSPDANGIISGEWEANSAMASYEDVKSYFDKHGIPRRASFDPSTVIPRINDEEDDPSRVISGEWSASWALATYDDVLTYFANQTNTNDAADKKGIVGSM